VVNMFRFCSTIACKHSTVIHLKALLKCASCACQPLPSYSFHHDHDVQTALCTSVLWPRGRTILVTPSYDSES
jgi:hypothetical protein